MVGFVFVFVACESSAGQAHTIAFASDEVPIPSEKGEAFLRWFGMMGNLVDQGPSSVPIRPVAGARRQVNAPDVEVTSCAGQP